MNQTENKQKVREFYDEIGWSMESTGYYQNARYEDLRPVSAEYIHKCHMRITPYFAGGGRFLLDVGCGPIQYPEYLTYSEKFERRVCADISLTALKEARKRIGDKGFFIVCDAANLPFKADCMDGMVSLHTFHHLDLEEQKKAWQETYRVLEPEASAVVVNGWTESKMMQEWQDRVEKAEKAGHFIARLRGKESKTENKKSGNAKEKATGTFVRKMDADWIHKELSDLGGGKVSFEIRCWRSVSVRWLRAIIHPPYGKKMLRDLFEKEESDPEYYGKYGQYPMIIMRKLS
ncbi:MAG: class I SAM-dependent methyltransferase [Anaerolineaceae bacterium]|nr:class I SAM-dependent methyltransferase [Anaerolineaceae bacterium]